MEGGTNNAGVDYNLVLKLIYPALVDNGDELDDAGAVNGAKDHVEEHFGRLK